MTGTRLAQQGTSPIYRSRFSRAIVGRLTRWLRDHVIPPLHSFLGVTCDAGRVVSTTITTEGLWHIQTEAMLFQLEVVLVDKGHSLRGKINRGNSEGDILSVSLILHNTNRLVTATRSNRYQYRCLRITGVRNERTGSNRLCQRRSSHPNSRPRPAWNRR